LVGSNKDPVVVCVAGDGGVGGCFLEDLADPQASIETFGEKGKMKTLLC